MFKRDPRNNPTTPVQKILTYGLILFMGYVYFSESKRDVLNAQQSTEKVIKVTNVISGKVEELNPNSQKISLAIKAGDIAKIKAKPVGSDKDEITIFEVEISAPKAVPAKNDKLAKPQNDAKKTVKKVEKPVEKPAEKVEKKTEEKTSETHSPNSNLDAKPVSN